MGALQAGRGACRGGRAREDPLTHAHPPTTNTSAHAHMHALSALASLLPCAETPFELLASAFITPTELFYIRNHLPVPQASALPPRCPAPPPDHPHHPARPANQTQVPEAAELRKLHQLKEEVGELAVVGEC